MQSNLGVTTRVDVWHDGSVTHMAGYFLGAGITADRTRTRCGAAITPRARAKRTYVREITCDACREVISEGVYQALLDDLAL